MPNNHNKIKAAISDQTRDLHERLVLEWKWRDLLRIPQPRHSMWALLENADDELLDKLERAFPQEVMAVRLARTTWVIQKLANEGLLVDT